MSSGTIKLSGIEHSLNASLPEIDRSAKSAALNKSKASNVNKGDSRPSPSAVVGAQQPE